jgi:hypothetical protein
MLAVPVTAQEEEEDNPFGVEQEEEKEEGCGEEESAPAPAEKKAPGIEAAAGEPTVVEDKAGNFKVTLPPGWTLDRPPQEDEGTGLRLIARREAGGGDVANIQILRIQMLQAEFFDQNEPADAVEKVLNENMKLFDNFYGEGYSKSARPRIDTNKTLGDGARSCGYELRGRTLEEEAKIQEAETLVRRGDTSVKVPEFQDLVIRGRVAMLSPYLYVTLVNTARALSDDPTLLAELDAIHKSFALATAEGMPPPLESDSGSFGNTLADPKYAEERKAEKLHQFKQGAKVAAAMEFAYILPPGFVDAERVRDPLGGIVAVGDTVALQVVAQDANNGWVWIRVLAQSSKSLPSNTQFIEKKKVFESWISNFESQARGTGRLPKKPQKIRVGSLDGDGCELEGKIAGFHATEVNMVTDKSGWRIEFELKTRGTGAKTFEEGIKTFLKKFRATKK